MLQYSDRPTTIIYHEVKPGIACPDGLAAAWVAAKAYPTAALQGAVYQTSSVPQPQPGDRLVIVDFSFPKAVLEAWAWADVEVILIDHHATAIYALKGLSDRVFSRFDRQECGATLAWQTFFPERSPPAFLLYVKDRDLWQHKLPQTKAVHEAYGAVGRSFALYDQLAALDQEALVAFLAPLGAERLAAKLARVQQMVATRQQPQKLLIPNPVGEASDEEDRWGDLVVVPCITLAADGTEDHFIADLGEALYKTFPEAPFVALIAGDGCSWLLRSDKDGNNTDVAAIAAAYGGGGHRNAAGFRQHGG